MTSEFIETLKQSFVEAFEQIEGEKQEVPEGGEVAEDVAEGNPDSAKEIVDSVAGLTLFEDLLLERSKLNFDELRAQIENHGAIKILEEDVSEREFKALIALAMKEISEKKRAYNEENLLKYVR